MRISTIIITGLVLTFAISCQEAVQTLDAEIHEIYSVQGDDQTKRPVNLLYKDVKYFDGKGHMVQRIFYNVDNTIKGVEHVQRDADKGVSNYYDQDSNLLAIYNLEYVEDNVIKRTAYDGNTKELLRIEGFAYSKEGLKIGKSIYDSGGNIVSHYIMKHDDNHNEVAFIQLDGDNNVKAEELFTIQSTDDSNRWTERWGYRDGKPSTFHRRTFSKK